MVNAWASEVEVRLNGVAYRAKLTLGALAELETALAAGSLIDLVVRFENGAFGGRDVLAVLLAGLRGGGEWRGQESEFLTAEVEGGPLGAARLAAQLLARAFALPD